MTLSPEIVVGILVALGTVGAVVHRLGWVVFSKTREPTLPERRSCPDLVLKEVKHLCHAHPSMVEAIKQHEAGSHRREEKIDKLTEAVMEVSRSVSAIEGFLQGRNGFHK